MGTSHINYDEAKRRVFEKHNGNIEILEFYGYCKNGRVKCNVCGHEWEPTINRVAKRTGCPNCQRLNQTLTIDQVREYIASFGCELKSEEYINAHESIKVKFECGHIREISYNTFQQGGRCLDCARKKRQDDHRTKPEEIIEFLSNYNLEFVGFVGGEFKTQRTTDVEYKCEYGHITKRKVDKIFNYPTCNICEMNDLRLLHIGSNNPRWKGGTVEYRNYCANNISEWKQKVRERCNYKCVLTNKNMDDVHHVYPFGKIIYEVLENLELPLYSNIGQYTEKEMSNIDRELKRLHEFYPPGVCLTRTVHQLFHNMYGRGDTSPEQWYEFVDLFKSGKIMLPEEI